MMRIRMSGTRPVTWLSVSNSIPLPPGFHAIYLKGRKILLLAVVALDGRHDVGVSIPLPVREQRLALLDLTLAGLEHKHRVADAPVVPNRETDAVAITNEHTVTSLKCK